MASVAATAELLASDGAHVLIAGRTQEKLDRVAETLAPVAAAAGGTVRWRVADADDEDDVRALVEDATTPTGSARHRGRRRRGRRRGRSGAALHDRHPAADAAPQHHLGRAAPQARRCGDGARRRWLVRRRVVDAGDPEGADVRRVLRRQGRARDVLQGRGRRAGRAQGAGQCGAPRLHAHRRHDRHDDRRDRVIADYMEQQPLDRAGESKDIAGAIRYFAGPESSWTTGQMSDRRRRLLDPPLPRPHAAVGRAPRRRAGQGRPRRGRLSAWERHGGSTGRTSTTSASANRFVPAPAITIGAGETALYQAIVGDPLADLAGRTGRDAVTGVAGGVVNPALALHFSIGQSTVATRRVIANLFYRGVVLRRPVPVGRDAVDDRRDRAPAGDQSRKPDRPPRGMVLLGIRTVDQRRRGRRRLRAVRAAPLPRRRRRPDSPTISVPPTGRSTSRPTPSTSRSGWDLRRCRHADGLGARRVAHRPAARHRDRRTGARAAHAEPGRRAPRRAPRPAGPPAGLRRPHHRPGAGVARATAAVDGHRHRLAQLRSRRARCSRTTSCRSRRRSMRARPSTAAGCWRSACSSTPNAKASTRRPASSSGSRSSTPRRVPGAQPTTPRSWRAPISRAREAEHLGQHLVGVLAEPRRRRDRERGRGRPGDAVTRRRARGPTPGWSISANSGFAVLQRGSSATICRNVWYGPQHTPCRVEGLADLGERARGAPRARSSAATDRARAVKRSPSSAKSSPSSRAERRHRVDGAGGLAQARPLAVADRHGHHPSAVRGREVAAERAVEVVAEPRSLLAVDLRLGDVAHRRHDTERDVAEREREHLPFARARRDDDRRRGCRPRRPARRCGPTPAARG